MKKASLLFLIVSLTASLASAAGWSTPTTIKTLKAIGTDGRVFFTSPFNASHTWVFDGTTLAGKNMLTLLLAAKTSGLIVTFNESNQRAAEWED